MTNGQGQFRHTFDNKAPGQQIPARALTYVQVRKLKGPNGTKVRPAPILRRPRCQFDTNEPWWRAAKPDRRDIKPAQHTSPNVCGRSSARVNPHRSAACL